MGLAKILFRSPPDASARPRRVMIQGMNFPPEIIGVGKYTGELAAYLQAQGHAVDVIAALPHYPGFFPRGGRSWVYRTEDHAGIRVTRCPLVLRRGGQGIWRLVAPLSFAIAAAPAMLWRMLRRRPDIVLCVEPTLFAAPAALLGAWLCGSRTALHVQDLEVDAAFATEHLRGRAVRRAAELVERLILRRFDAVVTISDAMAARLAHKGVAPERLSVARNWIQPSALPLSGPPHAYRAALGIGAAEPVVLYAGHLGAKQGIPTLLDALRLMSRTTRIVVAGEGPLAAAVAAARANLPGLVVLPLQPPDRMGALLAMADVHVLPQDGRAADLVFPSKLGPMLATGRPVVVTANPGTELAEWLGDAAIVVAADAPDALARALDGVLAGPRSTDPARAEALVRTLDAGTVLPALERTLLRLLERPGPSAAQRPDAVAEPASETVDSADALAQLAG